MIANLTTGRGPRLHRHDPPRPAALARHRRRRQRERRAWRGTTSATDCARSPASLPGTPWAETAIGDAGQAADPRPRGQRPLVPHRGPVRRPRAGPGPARPGRRTTWSRAGSTPPGSTTRCSSRRAAVRLEATWVERQPASVDVHLPGGRMLARPAAPTKAWPSARCCAARWTRRWPGCARPGWPPRSASTPSPRAARSSTGCGWCRRSWSARAARWAPTPLPGQQWPVRRHPIRRLDVPVGDHHARTAQARAEGRRAALGRRAAGEQLGDAHRWRPGGRAVRRSGRPDHPHGGRHQRHRRPDLRRDRAGQHRRRGRRGADRQHRGGDRADRLHHRAGRRPPAVPGQGTGHPAAAPTPSAPSARPAWSPEPPTPRCSTTGSSSPRSTRATTTS